MKKREIVFDVGCTVAKAIIYVLAFVGLGDIIRIFT